MPYDTNTQMTYEIKAVTKKLLILLTHCDTNEHSFTITK